VIFDAASLTRRQRDDLRAIAARYGACVRVIWLDVLEEVVVARWRLNRETGERYDVRYDDFAQVLTSFEAPGKDENVLRYDQSEPLAERIERNV
jgi:predicted kinase